MKVREGEKERLQAYEGVVIARTGSGLNESFTVRKISYGEGVERVFPVHAPLIDSIKLVRRGKVRRAKLYYLRGRRGKSARIAERSDARERRDGERGGSARYTVTFPRSETPAMPATKLVQFLKAELDALIAELPEGANAAFVTMHAPVQWAASNNEIIRSLGVRRGGFTDLIVLDWMLPGLDGMGVCRAVRAAPKTDSHYT